MLARLLLIGAFTFFIQGSLALSINSGPLKTSAAAAEAHHGLVSLAVADASPSAPPAEAAKKQPTPEERMQARFPQPVKVGDLIGLPVLDGGDSTIGYVENVVKTKDGKIQLVVPYGKWFGWLRSDGWLNAVRRPVVVPIEVVAILGRQIDALDMERTDFDHAPVWIASAAAPMAPGDMIQIAVARR